MTLLGAVLTGGQSSRFGSDKALALLDGKPLIDHAAGVLAALGLPIVLCGRAYPVGAIAVLADWPAPALGPLGGLCAALRYGQAHGYATVITIGCDVPGLPAKILTELIGGDTAAYLAASPVVGRWPTALSTQLEAHLTTSDRRSIRHWAQIAHATAISSDADIPNLNSPDDLAAFTSRSGSA